MGDRKVLNKYIPADFDPSKVPRGKKLSSKDGTVPVRMMLPFSLQCSTCNTFLYRGRKFNSKKEPVKGSNGKYLGIQRFRFYIKCNHCSRPISFLTDPKNADYEMESGGTRNYEMNKDKDQTEAEAAADKEQAESEDPMKALESRVVESQKEMADMDNLEEIKAMNARHTQLLAGGVVDPEAVLKATGRSTKEEDKNSKGDLLTADDEALVKSIQFGRNSNNNGGIKRLTEEDERQLDHKRKLKLETLKKQQNEKNRQKATIRPVIKVKRKQAPAANTAEAASKKAKPEAAASDKVEMSCNVPSGGLSGLLGGYGSDSDSD